MNKIFISGRMCKDIEVRSLNQDTQKGRFTLAVDRSRKDSTGKKVTDFLNCQVWNKTCDVLQKYSGKGKRITVLGELNQNRYTNKDGVEKEEMVINVSEVFIIDYKEQDKPNEPHKTMPESHSVNPDVQDSEDIPF